jgi:predicted DNA-binding antitoxin AbrB/MazE fold protein
MQKTVDAIYENGALRPLEPLTWLAEHAQVKVTIATEAAPRRWADCVGILPDDDAKEMLKIIEDEFEKIDLVRLDDEEKWQC